MGIIIAKLALKIEKIFLNKLKNLNEIMILENEVIKIFAKKSAAEHAHFLTDKSK